MARRWQGILMMVALAACAQRGEPAVTVSTPLPVDVAKPAPQPALAQPAMTPTPLTLPTPRPATPTAVASGTAPAPARAVATAAGARGGTVPEPVITATAQLTVEPADPTEGDTVTVRWRLPGARDARLALATGANWYERVELSQTPQPGAGSAQVRLPRGRAYVRFSAVAQNAPHLGDLGVVVQVRCISDLCRDDARQNAGGLTPATAAAPYPAPAPPVFVPVPMDRTASAAYQPFQRGFMVWLAGDPAVIWILSDDGRAVEYRDAWHEATPLVEAVQAPAGLLTPVRGFGALWHGNSQIRDSLGFALRAEQGYVARLGALQTSKYDGPELGFTLPDGRAVVTGRSSAALLDRQRYWQFAR